VRQVQVPDHRVQVSADDRWGRIVLLVLWFDWDGDPAMALHAPGSPGSLRANGAEFRAWVAAHGDLLE
jgi:hypothetical protein